ncbi:flagellar hook capping FlgD N-terminal domain-containing protein [Roseibaca sp. Y0-43]|uniref:flagellar hook capping FlgD N-terminal domain-containing protein n=1 Tax=Roseibaca sp. Y0-43 TaxID=2816854 RepID=UPI001D0C3924|nr:flagellar hook capping FlgD N-terminal domain-containing protein [Roseibaca sp. Y0-43]MCC1481303.1 flagellar hook assembly protein FlgD [Roseibaca sp. Y0-43]
MLDPLAPAMTSRPSPSQTGSGSVNAGDFQTFLSMLTAQIQNQNPLEPIQSSDFAAQLATFSGVEQQVQTNQLLTQLAGRMGLSELASWVGRDVLSAAPLRFDGSPLQLVPPEVAGANRAELVVTDANGAEIGRYPVDPASSEILFEVPPDNGVIREGEYYSFTMVSYQDDTELGENPVLGYSNVREARSDAGMTLLVLEGGHIISSDDVIGLRDPVAISPA